MPIFFNSSRKIDGTRTPRDERRRAQHNEGKVKVKVLGQLRPWLHRHSLAWCLESQITGHATSEKLD